jgi:hypothetical protein
MGMTQHSREGLQQYSQSALTLEPNALANKLCTVF